MTQPAIVLFDGICNLCNATVRFIIANDPDGHFRFAALQSASGARVLRAHGPRVPGSVANEPSTVSSIVVLDEDGVHERSSAALRVARGLRRPWCWLARLTAVPAGIRDPVYDWIARNRYRWFGRQTVCAQPTSEQRDRFIIDELP